MAKSDWIAQGMAESAAWQSRRQESTQCLGIYIYTMCPWFKQEAAVCDMCVAERVGLQDSVCVCVCLCLCIKARAGHRAKFQDVIFSTLKA
jgi:hypothetical protein